MNAQRRKDIAQIIADLAEIAARIENVKNDEQEAFDNLPESFQDGDKGQAMQEAIDSLEEAESSANDAQNALENIC